MSTSQKNPTCLEHEVLYISLFLYFFGVVVVVWGGGRDVGLIVSMVVYEFLSNNVCTLRVGVMKTWCLCLL